MSVWRVIYISIVVRQTMACWRQHFPLLCVKTMACWHHHFPLLCVKQCNADVSTFHCVSLHTETHFVPDPHMQHVETDSVWRVIEGKWCLGSGIRIRYPDHHQNLMEWSLGSWLPSHYISFKSVHNFLSNPANRPRALVSCANGLCYCTTPMCYLFIMSDFRTLPSTRLSSLYYIVR